MDHIIWFKSKGLLNRLYSGAVKPSPLRSFLNLCIFYSANDVRNMHEIGHINLISGEPGGETSSKY